MACNDPRSRGPWLAALMLGLAAVHGLNERAPTSGRGPALARSLQGGAGGLEPTAAERAAEQALDGLLLAAKHGWREDHAALLDQITQLGPLATPALIKRCLSGVQPVATGADGVLALNRYQMDLALAAVARLGPEAARIEVLARGSLAAALEDTPGARRLLALASVCLPTRAAAELASIIGSRELPRETRQELRAACARWALRDGGFLAIAAPLLRSGNAGLEMAVLQGLCDADQPQVLDELEARLIGGKGDPSTLLALAGQVADEASLDQRERWSHLAAGWCTSQNPGLAAEACRLIARLRATWAAEALLPALEGTAPVRSAAQAALAELSGLRYPAQRSLWAHFIAGERAFEAAQLPELLSRVRNAPIERLAPVLRELESHPFARERLLAALADRRAQGEDAPLLNVAAQPR